MQPAKAVEEALTSSELLDALAAARVPDDARALKKVEIDQLERQGCYCTDWATVRVGEGFQPAFVRNSVFQGDCYIGATGIETKVGPVTLPSGIYDSVVADAIVSAGALVKGLGILARYFVAPGAVVYDCGSVVCSPEAAFGIGRELPLAIETGGREVPTYPEITVEVAAHVAGNRADKQMLAAYAEAVGKYVAAVKGKMGCIGAGAMLVNTAWLKDVFIGAGAVVAGATAVENSTLLSQTGEKCAVLSGAFVKNSILQWGCEAATMAIVQNSVMCEHSHAERHGKVTDSLIGPNTGVAEGEVTASLVGPFVGFHHQALLIAAYWPEGKGNVGYGANVGSNHTSKAPDQEIWPGEGAFFGLGTNVKYPADFSNAPYVIIASGVATLPQKVAMPFSLINSPAENIEGVSPAYNEILPGWVLSDNIFTLRRNEGKYKKRNQAKRSTFVFDVFRPDTVDLMLDARTRLRAAGGKDIYLESDLPGIGKNYMKEEARAAGIEAYTFYIRYYALGGLKRRLETVGIHADVLEKPSDDARWEHERQILAAEFPGRSPKELLAELVKAQEKIAHDTQVSKEKDDKRGVRVIPDYSEAHQPAAEDAFVKETWQATEQLKKEVSALVAKL